jgi:uncharacterized protein (DUF488 family)
MVKTKQARFEISTENIEKKENKVSPLSSNKVQIFTIGFTKKSLKEFIQLLKKKYVEKVIDIRLRPYGQLAGYSNKEDLRYVLEEYEKIKYQHELLLAPTNEMLVNYRKDMDWVAYEKRFNELLKERNVGELFESITNGFTRICLLCSEDRPDKCHRRLVAEYFSRIAPNTFEIIHITRDDLEKSSNLRGLDKITKPINVVAEPEEDFNNEYSKNG